MSLSRYREAWERAALSLLQAQSPEDQRRAASSSEEHRAARAVCWLHDQDEDAARHRNRRGYSASDTHTGRRLAWQLRADALLCERDWALALRLARHYAGQLKEAGI